MGIIFKYIEVYKFVIFRLSVFPEDLNIFTVKRKGFPEASLFTCGMTVSYIILYFKRVHCIFWVKKLNSRKNIPGKSR